MQGKGKHILYIGEKHTRKTSCVEVPNIILIDKDFKINIINIFKK